MLTSYRERAYCPWNGEESKVVVNNRKLSETISLTQEKRGNASVEYRKLMMFLEVKDD